MFILIEKTPRSILVAINIILALLLGLMDYITGIELSLYIFYFLPIMIVSWYIGKKMGILFSFFCSTIWLVDDVLGGHIYSSNYYLAWNVIMRLLIFMIISLLIHRLKQESERAKNNELLIQKSFTIIDTSQRITGIIVENISKYNTELFLWIEKQKANGKIVSKIIESTSLNIGSNLRALTEVSFGQLSSDKNIKIEDIINSLQKKLTDLNKNNKENEEKNNKK